MPKVKAIFSTLPQKESALVDTARQHWLATPISSKGIKRKHSKVNNAYLNREGLETFLRLHVATVLQFVNQRQIAFSILNKNYFWSSKHKFFCLELGRGQILSIKSFWCWNLSILNTVRKSEFAILELSLFWRGWESIFASVDFCQMDPFCFSHNEVTTVRFK